MAEAENEPEALHRYDISSFPPRETASNPRYWDGGWGGMALSADGSRLEGAAGADDAFQELCSQTLQPDGVVYPGGDYPAAAATSATDILATGLSGYDSPNLAAYRTGVTTPFWTATTPSEDSVQDAGLALSPDGTTLYAAVDGTAPGGPALLIETYTLPPAPSEAVSDPCPKPSAAVGVTGGSPPTQSSTTTVSRSGHKVTAKLRVRVLRRHPPKPTAAFLLTLTLQPRPAGRAGYRYTLALTGLRCAGGATKVNNRLRCPAHHDVVHGPHQAPQRNGRSSQ